MPYVNIRIAREGAAAGQKAELIGGVADNRRIGGLPVRDYRAAQAARESGR